MNRDATTCPTCGRRDDGPAATPQAYRATRAPLISARYNLRAACLELILLERHFLDSSQHCDDCISKHLLTVEALGSEAVTMGREEDATSLRTLVDVARELARLYRDGDTSHFALGQMVRSVRKKLAPYCLDPRDA